MLFQYFHDFLGKKIVTRELLHPLQGHADQKTYCKQHDEVPAAVKVPVNPVCHRPPSKSQPLYCAASPYPLQNTKIATHTFPKLPITCIHSGMVDGSTSCGG